MSQMQTHANGVAALTAEEMAEQARKKIGSEELKRLLAIEKTTKECSPQVLKAMGTWERAIVLANGVQELRALISDKSVVALLPLINSSLGFRTDKPKADDYPLEVVKDCLIQALLMGLYPIGNEFNIISGRTYVTREGFTRLLAEFEGLTDLKINPEVPRMIREDGAIVAINASWIINGKRDELRREIPVRINKGMGADGILGKADRKIKAAIYARLTGSSFTTEGEVEEPVAGSERTTPAKSGAALLAEMGKKPEPQNTPGRGAGEAGAAQTDPRGDAPQQQVNGEQPSAAAQEPPFDEQESSGQSFLASLANPSASAKTPQTGGNGRRRVAPLPE